MGATSRKAETSQGGPLITSVGSQEALAVRRFELCSIITDNSQNLPWVWCCAEPLTSSITVHLHDRPGSHDAFQLHFIS